jgi:hypothetical protein
MENESSQNRKRKFSEMNQNRIEAIIEMIKNLETPSKLNSIEKILDVDSDVSLQSPFPNPQSKTSRKTNDISREELLETLKNSKYNNVQAGRVLGCSEGLIRKLKKSLLSEEDIKILKKKKQRRIKKGQWIELEKILYIWFSEQREKGLTVQNSDLITEAKGIAESLCITNFKASIGFINNFRKRNKISYRRSTHFMQKCTDLVFDETEKFIKNVLNIKLKHYQDNFLSENAEEIEFINMVNFLFYILG